MTIGLVGQDQITTFTSPVNGTSPIDANTVRGNDNTVKTAFNVHDKDPTIHFQSSLAASRPPAGVPGRKWLDTDTRRVYYDDGVTWNEIAYLAAGGGGGTAIPGPVVITGGGITTDGGITAAGDITAGGNVIAHTLFIADGTAAQNRGTVARTNNVTRWFVGANGAAETGANAGSDLSIAAYSDAGALLRESFVVKRDTGAITVTTPTVTVTGDVSAGGYVVAGATTGTGNFQLRVQSTTGDRIRMGSGPAGTGPSIQSTDAAESVYRPITFNFSQASFVGASGSTLAKIMADGSFVVGNDPGGMGKLRVGGDINVGGAIRSAGGDHLLSYDAPTTTVAVGSGNPGFLDLYGGGARRARIMNDGTVVIGTDTGGGEMLRVGGAVGCNNNVFLEPVPSTGQIYIQFTTGGGQYYVGVENSLGNALSGVPYSLTLGAVSARSVVLRVGLVNLGVWDNTSTADMTALNLYTVALGLVRIRTGPAGSGPGGVGRVLYVV